MLTGIYILVLVVHVILPFTIDINISANEMVDSRYLEARMLMLIFDYIYLLTLVRESIHELTYIHIYILYIYTYTACMYIHGDTGPPPRSSRTSSST